MYTQINITTYLHQSNKAFYDSDNVDGLESDLRLVSGRVVSFSVFRTSLESGRLSCYIKNTQKLK